MAQEQFKCAMVGVRRRALASEVRAARIRGAVERFMSFPGSTCTSKSECTYAASMCRSLYMPPHACFSLFLLYSLPSQTLPFTILETSATSPLLGIIGTPHINLNHGGQRHRHRVPGHARSGPGLRLQFSARQKVNIQSGDEVVGVLCLAGTLRTAFSRLNTGNIITALIQGDEAGAAQFKPALSLSPLP